LDEELREGREEGLRLVGLRGWWLATLFGDIRVERRTYWDKAGKYRAWLEAGLPALQGPHHSRPWAQVLATLTGATRTTLLGIAPTKS